VTRAQTLRISSTKVWNQLMQPPEI